MSWITRAKRDETKEKRLAQMLDELEGGKLYMNMLWAKSNTNRRRASKQRLKA
ncbi:MAG: YdeI/OmpD-associated family protein [Anaerolineales bacterium]